MNNRKIWCTYIDCSKTLSFKVCSFNEAQTFDYASCTFYCFPIYANIVLRLKDINSLEIISSNFSRVEYTEIDEICERLKKFKMDSKEVCFPTNFYAQPFEIPSLILKYIPRLASNPTSARLELSKFFRSESYKQLLTFAIYNEQQNSLYIQ